MKKYIVATIVIAALLIVVGWTQTRTTQQWEYKVTTATKLSKGDQQYNELGAEGWELIQAIPIQSVGTTVETSLFFRRPKR